MENNFFSGSENLYKYLVSIGILMLVLTIYYPLKEKQGLEILKIELISELKTLEHSVTENESKAITLNNKVKHNQIKDNEKTQYLTEIKKAQSDNELNKIKIDGKIQEINTRNYYINYYNFIIWTFTPLGLFLVFYGFLKWRKSKINDDEKSKIEKNILNLKYQKELRENEQNQEEQDVL